MPDALSSLYSASPLFTMLSSSLLLDRVKSLSELSGEFYFYEPRERLLNSGSGSPLEWQSVSPNEADSLSMGELDRYSSALCASLGSSVTKLSPEEAVLLISERKIWQSVSILWVSDYALYGDYCGAPHTASNCRVLLEEFGGSPQCREACGSYGSRSVVIDPRYLSDELLESLQSLEDYPILDENDCSELELELQDEAWESWAKRDFSQSLEERLSSLCGDELAEQAVKSLSSAELWAVFESLREEASEYWQSQGSPDQWIDLERIVERASTECLLSLLSHSLSQALQAAMTPLLSSLQLSLSKELLASS
jgi:hypothetical protein